MLDEVVSLASGAAEMSVADALREARQLLGEEATIEFGRDMLEKFVCPRCGEEQSVFASLGKIRESAAECPHCEGTRREAITFYRVDGSESFLDRSLDEVGVPPFDILFARSGDRLLGLELTADATAVLGDLTGDEEAVQWL